MAFAPCDLNGSFILFIATGIFWLTRVLVEIKVDLAIVYELVEANMESYIARGYSALMVGCISTTTKSQHWKELQL